MSAATPGGMRPGAETALSLLTDLGQLGVSAGDGLTGLVPLPRPTKIRPGVESAAPPGCRHLDARYSGPSGRIPTDVPRSHWYTAGWAGGWKWREVPALVEAARHVDICSRI